MEDEQEFLREQCKRLKWEEGVSYKQIAEDLLDMNYNAFMNFMHRYKRLGYYRAKKLESYIIDMM